jgi:hypothetical protein
VAKLSVTANGIERMKDTYDIDPLPLGIQDRNRRRHDQV